MTRPGKRSSRRARDLELAAATSAHYEDPAYYTSTYDFRREDVEYYVARARRSRGPVLELGCGNGRITIPIARAGIAITGVDISKPMLADPKTRLAAEPPEVRARVTARAGDMTRLKVGGEFALVICPFNALLHLYDRPSVERFLAGVRAHLAPRGRLVFDVSIPQPEELARKPEKAFTTPKFIYPGLGYVRYHERFEYEPLRQILFVSMDFEPMSGAPGFMTPLAHRQFFPAELEALLHYNGFDIESLEGDYGGPATNESMTLVYTARPRAARREAPRAKPARARRRA